MRNDSRRRRQRSVGSRTLPVRRRLRQGFPFFWQKPHGHCVGQVYKHIDPFGSGNRSQLSCGFLRVARCAYGWERVFFCARLVDCLAHRRIQQSLRATRFPKECRRLVRGPRLDRLADVLGLSLACCPPPNSPGFLLKRGPTLTAWRDML